MAEFCVSCWNEINETHYPEEAYVLSWDFELCEGCGEYKRVVTAKRKGYFLRLALGKFLPGRKIR